MKKFPSLRPRETDTASLDAYEELVQRLVIEDRAEASKMFGMPCIKLKKKAIAGFYKGDMVFKLSGDAREKALAIKDAHLFDPMGGRPMKQWVQLPWAAEKHWLTFAKAALTTE